MGGGVSLGAYSGASLTESLKLLLLYGQDDQGQSYDSIELDCMSGASAGAISLCVMISCLLNYKRFVAVPEDDSTLPLYRVSLTEVDQRLEDQFQASWTDLCHASDTRSVELIESLRALETAQIIQERLWVEEVNMTKLLRLEQTDIVSKDNFSILDRHLLLSLVRDYVLRDLDQLDACEPLVLSSQRLLFACSLTNLIPQSLGEVNYQEHGTEPLVRELHKAHASYNHKEMRVFDFQLSGHQDSITPLPKSIVVDRHADHINWSLSSTETWSRIAATAIACGAFPYAFEPVVLRRYFSEYFIDPDRLPKAESQISFEPNVEEGEDDTHISFHADFLLKYKEHRKQFVQWHYEHSDQEAESIKDQQSSYLYSYVDGGALNNEPIREAFRLASFLDSRDPSARSEFDRLVIFVDPIVRTTVVTNRSSDFDRYQTEYKLGSIRIDRNSELNRIFSYTGRLVQALRNQGSIKEEHKISTYLSSIKLYSQLSRLIRESQFTAQVSEEFVETLQEFYTYHKRQLKDENIISFNILDPLFVFNEIKKYTKKLNTDYNPDHLVSSFYMIMNGLNKHDNIHEVTVYLSELMSDHGMPVVFFKKLFYEFILRLVLQTDGKDPGAMRLAITPVVYSMDSKNKEHPKTIDLPGAEFEAFGGFVNKKARQFSSRYGRFNAYKALMRGDFRRQYHKVMNDDAVVPNEYFIPSKDHLSEYYDQILENGSPLSSDDLAQAYWVDIRNKIYHLIRRRLYLSLSARQFWTRLLIILTIITVVLGTPWFFATKLGWFGLIIQILLSGVLGLLALYSLHKKNIKQLNAEFYFHHLPIIQISIFHSKMVENVSYYRLNEQGPFCRLYQDEVSYILPLPYHIHRKSGDHEDDLSGARITFYEKGQVNKGFNQHFTSIEDDLLRVDQVKSIQLYKKNVIGRPTSKWLSISTEDLLSLPGLLDIERYISPYISCQVSPNGEMTLELKDRAKPLWEYIHEVYRPKSPRTS